MIAVLASRSASSIRRPSVLFVVGLLMFVAKPNQTLATPISITNSGFDAFNASDYTFNGNPQTIGSPIPDSTFTLGFGNGVLLHNANPELTMDFAVASALGWSGLGVVQDSASLPINSTIGPGAWLGSNEGGSSSLAQTLTGIGLLPNTHYTLSVQVFDRDTSPYLDSDIIDLPPSILVQLKAGTTVLGNATGLTPPNGGGTSWTLNYTSPSSGVPTGNLQILIAVSGDSGNVASQAVFDNVTLDAVTVPEPMSLGTMALGLVLLIGGCRAHSRHRAGSGC